MSAIFGIYGDAEPGELDGMSTRLTHLGSHSNIWSVKSGLYFGERFRKDGQEEGPSDGKTVIFDGVIDNVTDICELLGIKDSEKFDITELLFELYNKMGSNSFSYINGQFSVALWDNKKECLVLACDALGTRPLYYVESNGRYIFASEYKAILAISSVSAKPDVNVFQYLHLTKYIPPGTSCVAGIKGVAGGTFVEIYGNQVKINKYNNVAINITGKSDGEYTQSLQQCFLDAVDRQSQSFDKIGVSLSGGLDSLLLVAALKKVSPDKQLLTYTSGFDSTDENIIGALEVADYYNTSHHEIFLKPNELPRLISETLWHMEDPIGREEKIFYNITAREAAKSVDMLFAGHNADALFGGMPRHLVVSLATKVPFLKKPLEEFYDYTQLGIKPNTMVGSTLTNLYFKGKNFPPPNLIGSTFKPERTTFPSNMEPLNQLLRNSLCNGANANSAIEKIHAGYGINFNSPFLDSEFVKRSFEIPDRLKIKGKKQKYILRKIGEGIIPEAMQNRKKGLLRLQHDNKFCDVLDSLSSKYLTQDKIKSRRLFEAEYVRMVTKRNKNEVYSTDRIYRIWSLILTELWCQIFIDNRGLNSNC